MFSSFSAYILISARSFSADLFSFDGDDGYKLWLKYEPVTDPAMKAEYLKYSAFISASGKGEIRQSAVHELQTGFKSLLGKQVSVNNSVGNKSGGIILRVEPNADIKQQEGYRIQLSGGNIIISSKSESGILYGTFALLRHMQMQLSVKSLKSDKQPESTIPDAQSLG